MKHHISLSAFLVASVFVTGCSQQQVQEAPAKTETAVETVTPTPTPAPTPVAAPVATNPNCHSHPSNSVTKSVNHCHKNPRGQHNYGTKAAGVDVTKLQTKLKAKGLYKGPIDGVINEDTRDALKKFQSR